MEMRQQKRMHEKMINTPKKILHLGLLVNFKFGQSCFFKCGAVRLSVSHEHDMMVCMWLKGMDGELSTLVREYLRAERVYEQELLGR